MARRTAATTAVFAALLIASYVVAPAHAACRVRLDIVSEESTFTFGGENRLDPKGIGIPLSGTVTPKDGVASGFVGALYAQAPDGTPDACPTTSEDWLNLLGSMTISSEVPFWYSPVTFYPAVLPGETLGFPFQPQSIALKAGIVLSRGTDASFFNGTLDASILQGWVYSKTSFTGERYDNIAGLASSSELTGALTLTDAAPSRLLTLDVPSFTITFSTAPSEVSFLGSTYEATNSLTLTGRLVLRAELGCTTSCGDKGKCVIDANGAPTCQCECGWTTDASGACNAAGGIICTRMQTGGTTVILPPPACNTNSTCNCTANGGDVPPSSSPAPDVNTIFSDTPPASPPPEPLPSVNSSVVPSDSNATLSDVAPDANGNCPEGFALDVSGTTCQQCATGFAGPSCGTCQNDEACQVAGGNTLYECRRDASFLQRTTNKNYTCNVKDTTVQGLLGPVVGFTCSTLPPDSANTSFTGDVAAIMAGVTPTPGSPIGSTPFCSMTFRMPALVAGSYVRCTGWGCEFSQNATRAVCSSVQCSCPNGCTTSDNGDLTGLFNSIKGSIGITCDASPASSLEAACKVDLKSLPISTVVLTCSTSECYSPESTDNVNGNVIGDDTAKPATISDPIIAALPMFALLATSAVLLLATLLVARPFVRGVPKGTDFESGVRPAPRPASPGPVAEGEEPPSPTAQSVSRRSTGSDAGERTTPAPFDAITSIATKSHVARSPHHHHTSTYTTVVLGRPGSSSSSCPDGVPTGSLVSAAKGKAHTGMSSDVYLKFLDMHVISTGLGCTKARTRHILHGVSGHAGMGQVTGILGPSGSGKSTLLNVLSGQVQDGGAWQVTGSITLGGASMTAKQLCNASAYVPQHDLLLRYLTVEESLRCSAALRLGPGTTSQEVYGRVDEVLRELNMSHLRHAMSYRGTTTLLSGGERQRLMIGMELVTEPLILFLDEPTSGLDSYNALQVLNTLTSVAAAGRIVITSLHQPSPILFNLLDTATLMARGYMIFQGPPSQAPAAFRGLGLPCPDDAFIAEHMLEVVQNPATVEQLMATVSRPDFQAARRAEAASAGTVPALPGPKGESEDSGALVPAGGMITVPKRPPAPWYRVLGVLCWRTLVDTARNPALALLHAAFSIAIGLVVGFVYYQVENDTAGAQNRVGAIFFVINLFSFLASTALDVVQLERQVVEREMVRRYYSPWAYMSVKVVLDSMVLRAIPGVLFSSLFYWLMGLRPSAGAFLTFVCVFCTYTALIGCISLLCAVLSSTSGRAVLVLNLLLLNFVLFAGFLVNKDSITWALRWICYLSPMRYAWEALVVNELAPMTLTLTAPELPTVPPVRGTLFLSLLGVNPSNLTIDIVVLDCMYVLVVAATLLGMALRVHLLRKGRA